jgi:hypothetical protein
LPKIGRYNFKTFSNLSVAAERFDGVLEEGLLEENRKVHVIRMFVSDGEANCRPYRSRTCNTQIKSNGVLNQSGKEVK